jgi:uncharacterized protein (TIRG00374 family)
LYKKTILVISGVIGLYAILMFASDIKSMSEQFQNFRLEYVFLIIPIIIFSFFIRGFRWLLFLKYLKINIGIKNSFGIYFAGMAFGVTPAKVGELIKSQILKNKYSIAISKTAPIIFVERYYDLFGIAIISFVVLLFLNFEIWIVLILLAVSILLLGIAQQKSISLKILNSFSKIPFFNKYVNNLITGYETIHVLLSPKIFIKSILLSKSAWIVESVGVFFIFQAFGSSLDFSNILFIFTSSTLLGGISLLPAGIGVTEGGMIAQLLLHDIDYSFALCLVLTIRLFTLWMSVIIGFISLKFNH